MSGLNRLPNEPDIFRTEDATTGIDSLVAGKTGARQEEQSPKIRQLIEEALQSS